VAARLAVYGFNGLRLSDEWRGIDCIAYHFNGSTLLKAQFKGGLNIDLKHSGENIDIAFCAEGIWCLYPHDEVRNLFPAEYLMVCSNSR
jgi:hypothetical protein